MKTLLHMTILVMMIVLVTACGGADKATPQAATAAPAGAAPAEPAATATPLPEPTATTVPTAAPTEAPTEAPTATPEPTLTPEPTQAATAASGPCSNDFFPVVEGASWTYNTTGAGASTYTRAIAEVRDDGFTMTNTTDSSPTPLHIDYLCGKDGISSATLGNLPGAAGSFSLSVTNFSGTNFPPADQWKTGATWSASYTVEGGGTIQDIQADATGQVTQDYEIVGQESITVPAGTFNAYQVNSTLSQQLTLAMNGITVPVEVTISSTDWYAKGIGQIKSMTLGDFASTSELASYQGL